MGDFSPPLDVFSERTRGQYNDINKRTKNKQKWKFNSMNKDKKNENLRTNNQVIEYRRTR